MPTTERKMPTYKCHKEVWALKIGEIKTVTDGAMIIPIEEGYAPVFVDSAYLNKHSAKVGG